MLSIVNEIITNTYSALTVTHEQRYVHDALQAIDNTDRFALLNGELIITIFRRYFVLI